MDLEPIPRELPHRFRTMSREVKPFVKSQWKSLVRPKYRSESLPSVNTNIKEDRFPRSPSGGLVDLSDSWMPTSFCNGGDASRFPKLTSTQAEPDPLSREVTRRGDGSRVLLNRWLYADPSELPPPPVPDKIALDTETCCTLGPPRLNDQDPQAYSPDSGYCSYDSTPSALRPTSLVVRKPLGHRHDVPIDNFDIRYEKINDIPDKPNVAELEGTGGQIFSLDLPQGESDHGLEPAQSPRSELLVSPLSIRSRGAIGLQSVVGSQTGSSGTDSASVYDIDDELIHAMLNHKLLQRLMEEFYSLLDSILRTSPHPQSTNSSGRVSEATTISSSFTSSSFLSQNSSLGKGKGRTSGSEPPDDDQDQDGRRKRSRRGDSGGNLYACPFYKYDARKYACRTESGSKFRSCTGPGFPSIARLRQHLRRVHTPPLQCRRCWQVFPDEPALETHARSANPCQVLDREVVEGISKTKFELLSRHGVRWNEIYQIIFPGAPLPESCYHGSSEPPVNAIQNQSACSLDLSAYEAYARKELPRLVEAMLEGMIQAETEPLEEKLKPLLVDVVRSCQSTLSHRWQTITVTASPSPPLQQYFQESLNPGAEPEFNFQESGLQSLMHLPTVVQSAYQEPPFWDGDMAMSTFEPIDAAQLLPSIAEHSSESGYASQSQNSNSEYLCLCHQYIDYSQAGGSNLDPMTLSSSHMPHISKFTSFTNFRPSLADLQERRVIRCNKCYGWQFT